MKRMIALAVIAALGLTGCGATGSQTKIRIEKDDESIAQLEEAISEKMNDIGIESFDILTIDEESAKCKAGDEEFTVSYSKGEHENSPWVIESIASGYTYYYSTNEYNNVYDYKTGELIQDASANIESKLNSETSSSGSGSATSKSSMIESDVRSHVRSEYADTDIDHITVNNDNIVLAYLVWNVKNSEETTKKMLRMYSDDLAATLTDDYDDLKEIAVFWNVPYLSKDYKWHYSCSSAGAYMDDSME